MVSGDGALTMLLVDDDDRYAEALFRDAQSRGIALRHASSLEEAKGIVESRAGALLCGAILDVECYRTAADEVPDSSFIIAATKYLTERAPDVPVAVITGVQPLFDRFSRDFAGTWEVYRKGRDEGRMLDALAGRAQGQARFAVARRHADAIAVAREHLGEEAAADLLSCLLSLEEASPPRIRGTIANVRVLQERIYIALARLRPDMVPEAYVVHRDKGVARPTVNVGMILEHLKGNYDPKEHRYRGRVFIHHRSPIYRLSETVYKVASDAVHADAERSAPTRYTAAALVYALLDILLWMKEIVGPRGPAVRFTDS
jgi:ActR/RegA family two-component response regulator